MSKKLAILGFGILIGGLVALLIRYSVMTLTNSLVEMKLVANTASAKNATMVAISFVVIVIAAIVYRIQKQKKASSH